MDIIWGILLIVFGLIAWGGQVLSAFTPKYAQRVGLMEQEADVDPAFFADVRGEAKWDSITLWILPFTGSLILLQSTLWIYFGLIGGSIYLYFGGRAILTRLELKKSEIRIGKPETLKMYYLFATLWGIIGLVTIIKAVKALINF